MKPIELLIGTALLVGILFAAIESVRYYAPLPAYARAADSEGADSRWFGGWRTRAHHHGFEAWCAGRFAGRIDAMLARAEESLELKPAQIDAWRTFTRALRDGEAEFRRLCADARATAEESDAPRQLARLESLMKAGVAALDRVRPAFEGLYSTLNADQRAMLDDLFARHAQR